MPAPQQPRSGDRSAWVARTATELVWRGLLGGDEPPVFEPLTGGVSSDIWIIRQGDHRVVVKRALAKLNVAQDWWAPVERNAADAEWLRLAGEIVPGAAPRVLYRDDQAGLFVMSYIDPAEAPVWKVRLLAGDVDPAFAASVGRTIGRIHAATAGQTAIATAFANAAAFRALRLSPYLEATAEKHPALAPRLLAIARSTARHQVCLIHGDVSPKNILVGANGPILLDAECATYGDPAFDLAFCLNHLLLKGLVIGQAGPLAAAFEALTSGYLEAASSPMARGVMRRTAALLPALLLARVDGKSPVEYIATDAQRTIVRGVAAYFLRARNYGLSDVCTHWTRVLSGTTQ